MNLLVVSGLPKERLREDYERKEYGDVIILSKKDKYILNLPDVVRGETLKNIMKVLEDLLKDVKEVSLYVLKRKDLQYLSFITAYILTKNKKPVVRTPYGKLPNVAVYRSFFEMIKDEIIEEDLRGFEVSPEVLGQAISEICNKYVGGKHEAKKPDVRVGIIGIDVVYEIFGIEPERNISIILEV